jgi:cubilin
VHFFSDISVTSSGFRLAYDATLEGCGGELIGTAGELHSPNFPFPYNHAADCIYVLTTSAGSSIDLVFSDFDLEGGSCTFDSLQLFDGPTVGYNPLTPRMCGTALPEPVNSTSNSMTIEFRSDTSVSGTGWRFSKGFQFYS